MKTILKALLWLFIALFFVLALTALGLKTFFPSEKVQQFIIKEAESKLHRQVRIGKLSLDLLKGLRLTDVQISERPNFDRGTFASSERIFVRPQLLPLLSKKLYIDVIALRAPKIFVVREKDGTYNFSDLKNSTATKSSPSAHAFLASRVSIKDGQIDFVDRSTAAISTQIRNLQLTIRHPSLVGPVALTTSLSVASNGFVANVEANSSVNFLDQSAQLGSIAITSGESKLEIFGDITQLKKPDPVLALKLRMNQFDPAFFKAMNWLPTDMKMTGKLQGEGTLNGTLRKGDFTLALNGQEMDVRYGSATFHKPIGTAMSLETKAAYRTPLAIDFNSFRFQVAQTVLHGTGTYSSRGYAFRLSSYDFPIETFMPLFPFFEGKKISGPGNLSFSLKSAPKGTQLQGFATVRDSSATFRDITLLGIQSKANFTAKDVSGTLTATKLDHAFFHGQNLSVRWNLLDVADISKMNGTASMEMGPGEVKNVDKITGKNPIARILLLPFAVMKKVVAVAKSAVSLPSLDGARFSKIEGDYAFRNGTMLVNKFDLVATSLTASFTGSIGLTGSQPIDANTQISLSESMVRGAVGKILNSGLGLVTVSVAIKGTVQKPEVKVDALDTGKSILKAIGGTAAEPIKQLDNLFKSLFKK